ncbi:MAG: lipocalin family protein [Candidatus Dadabacteria bacterium]
MKLASENQQTWKIRLPKLSFLSFGIILLLVISCKKNDNNSCSTDMNSIAGSYKITGYFYRASPSSQETDYTNIILPDACERDNLLVFNSNGSYQLVDAGVVCSPSSNDNGTWSLTGSTIYIDTEASTVESFDCKTLVVSTTDVNQTGDRVRIVLTKQ